MNTINEVELLGFVVTDIIKLGKEKNTITFRLKTVNRFKTSTGEVKDEEEFTNIVAFDKVADNIESYVQKGDTLMIKGRLHTRKFMKSDIQVEVTEVVVNTVTFVNVVKMKKENEEKYAYRPTEPLPLFVDLHGDTKATS